MKVYDIISEDADVAEAPVGMLKRTGQAIAGKFSQAAAAKGESSKEANQTFKDLKVWASRGDLDLKNLPVGDFKRFMQQKGYDKNLDQQIDRFKDASDPEATLDKKQIEQIVLAQTKAAAASDTSNIQKGKYAQKGSSSRTSGSTPAADLKKIADAVSKMSDAEKQQLAKLI